MFPKVCEIFHTIYIDIYVYAKRVNKYSIKVQSMQTFKRDETVTKNKTHF